MHSERTRQEAVSCLYLLIKYRVKEQIGDNIKKEASKIFPLSNVLVRKVKMLKKPKFDLTKLMELYQVRAEEPKKEEATKEEPKNKLDA